MGGGKEMGEYKREPGEKETPESYILFVLCHMHITCESCDPPMANT